MGKTFLMAVLALDLLVLGSSAYVLWDRVSKNLHPQSQVVQSVPAASAPPMSQSSDPLSAPGAHAPAIEEIQEENKTETAAKKTPQKGKNQKVVFSFRDPLAKNVSVTGTFNAWKPAPMKKDASNKWSAALPLAPGQYAYNFIVDGKTIRDPGKKDSKLIQGHKVQASVLTVK